MLGKAHFVSVLYPIIYIAAIGFFVLMTGEHFQMSADVIETITQGSIREHVAAWGLGHAKASEAILGIVMLLAETAYIGGNNFVDWYLAWKRKRSAAKSAIIS